VAPPAYLFFLDCVAGALRLMLCVINQGHLLRLPVSSNKALIGLGLCIVVDRVLYFHSCDSM
jgi:hypothetical protein